MRLYWPHLGSSSSLPTNERDHTALILGHLAAFPTNEYDYTALILGHLAVFQPNNQNAQRSSSTILSIRLPQQLWGGADCLHVRIGTPRASKISFPQIVLTLPDSLTQTVR